MEKKLSEILGFYFMVFQHDSRSQYVKCWLDGEEKAHFYTPEQIVGFCNKNGHNSKMTSNLKNAFSETSVFIWDVDGEQLKRASSIREERNIAEELFAPLHPTVSMTEQLTPGWKTKVDFDGDFIKIEM